MGEIKLVAFDLDGTLVDVSSSWVCVHEHFKVNNDHSLQAYLKGEIDDEEFMRRDIELWRSQRPVHISEIEKVLSNVKLFDGVKETISALRERGIKTVIISGGLDILANRVKEELGMDYSIANGLEFDSFGYLTGKGILNVELRNKGEPLRRIKALFGLKKENVASVGNTHIDVGMFEESAIGIAFRPEDEIVKRKADFVVENDMREIIRCIL